MYQTIVAGTDGSDTASEAVRQAAVLARTCGARLHLVCAYKPLDLGSMPFGTLPPNIHELVNPAKDVQKLLDGLAAKVQAEGVETEPHPRVGDAAEALVEVAEQVGADLIVVGSKGMTGARRFLLGSVPNAVSHHAPCNVLIVRTA